VSIGDTLAEARRQAGLTVTQVSQRTRIRETIIRGLERGDFSACGGDFYARGHIRSVARTVGTDPEPLIRQYDAMHGAPAAIRAADVFEPSTPIKLKERRSPNWSVAMIIALLLVIGYAVFHLASSSSSAKPAAAPPHQAASHPASSVPSADPSSGHAPSSAASPASTPSQGTSSEVAIHLTAVTGDCWVFITDANGQELANTTIRAGTSQSWTFRQAVTLRLGNPGAVRLTVNGRHQSPGTDQPVTLNFGPGQHVSG
jgi:cytoskeletal protein RodZ